MLEEDMMLVVEEVEDVEILEAMTITKQDKEEDVEDNKGTDLNTKEAAEVEEEVEEDIGRTKMYIKWKYKIKLELLLPLLDLCQERHNQPNEMMARGYKQTMVCLCLVM